MLPVSEQYLNSPCEMRSMDDGLILHGYVKAISDGCVEITGKNDRLPIIHCNTLVKVSLFSSTLGFQVLVGRVYLSTADFIRVVELQTAADYERRNFFRVKVRLSCRAVPVAEGDCGKEDRSFSATIEDMSLGGIFLSCGKELTEGEKLIVRLKLYGEVLPLLCKVLRKAEGSGRQETLRLRISRQYRQTVRSDLQISFRLPAGTNPHHETAAAVRTLGSAVFPVSGAHRVHALKLWMR